MKLIPLFCPAPTQPSPIEFHFDDDLFDGIDGCGFVLWGGAFIA